jgi:uncharacterized protein (TIGR03437 family)
MTKLLLPALATCLVSLPAFSAAPSIAAQGVKNAASYADPQMPNGSIAQGSIFNVFGSNLGPTPIAYASSLPLSTTLSGTTVTVTVGGTAVQCYMVYTSAGQIAAILPSTTPLGTGTISVSYNSTPSPTAPITVVKSSFGIFTINQQGTGQAVVQDGNYKFNSTSFAFQPGETVVIWGTGLGPIVGSDATTPPTGNLPGITVTVTVGGLNAPVTYSGRSGYSGDDQVAFTIPSSVSGCFVPVVISAGATGATPVYSNYTSIAVGTTTTCTSTTYPPGVLSIINSGGPIRVGSVNLGRSTSVTSFLGQSITSTSDVGDASFFRFASAGYFTGSSYDLQVGSCYVEIVSGAAGGTIQETGLDAGTAINVSGPGGSKQIPGLATQVGSYDATLGGGFALPGQTAPPLYLSPGTYTLNNGSGGKDVGPFNITITVPATFTWTNMSSITSVPRSQPLTVTWTGGDPTQPVIISGSSGTADNAFAAFVCEAPNPPGTFTVPVQILQQLPPSATTSGVALSSLQLSTANAVIASTLPSGLDFFTYGDSQAGILTGIPYQ